jgi:predicted NBD/HSP70 family sugar kinase
LVVSLGRGIGLGLILDGRLYRGAYGGAGEFGHVKIADDETPCACGATGCLEAVIADPALAATFTELAGRSMSTADAADAARTGNEAYRSVFDAAGRELGRAISNLVNILNPELIVLSGEGSHAADLMMRALTDELRQHTFDGLLDGVDVVVEPWDDEAWARGAASLVLAEMFQPALRPHDGVERPTLALSRTG